MGPTEARRLVASIARFDPDLIDLAERVSPAVRVDPQLLRRIRTRRLPELGPQTEADLWLGPLTDEFDIDGFTFHVEVGEELRRRLGRDQRRMAESREDLDDLHGWLAENHRVEESVRLAASAGTIEGTLEAERLLGEIVERSRADRERLAPWIRRVDRRLPGHLRGTKAGQTLARLAVAADSEDPGGTGDMDPPMPVWVRFVGGGAHLIRKRSEPDGRGWRSVPVTGSTLWVDGLLTTGRNVDLSNAESLLIPAGDAVELDDGHRRWLVHRDRRTWRRDRTVAESRDDQGLEGPSVTSLEWSSDERVAAGTDHGAVHIYNARTWTLTHLLTDHGGAVLAVAWSPDNRFLATAGVDAVTRVYDSTTWAVVAALSDHHDRITAVAWSPDGGFVVSAGNDRSAVVYETGDWQKIQSLEDHTSLITSAAWSPDGARLATAGYDRSVHVYRCDRWNRVETLAGHNGWITDVAWSPNGRLLATACHDGLIRTFDTTEWELDREIKTLVAAIAWSPGGTNLAGGSHDGAVHVWETARWTRTASVIAHTSRIETLAWSADGARLASAGDDGHIQVHHAVSWSTIKSISFRALGSSRDAVLEDFARVATKVDWSNDGRHMAAAGDDGTIHVYNTETWALIATVNDHRAIVTAIAWAPHEDLLATADVTGVIRIYRFDAEQRHLRIIGLFDDHQGRVSAVAWSPAGAYLVTAGHDGATIVYRTEGWRQTQTLLDRTGSITSATWSPTGTLLATTGSGGQLRVYDTGSWTRTHTLSNFATKSSWSHDGRILATISDGRKINFYETAGWALLSVVAVDKAWILDLAFSPDGTRLATAGNDTVVRIYSTIDWEQTEIPTRHLAPANSIVWSPDGTRVATAGADGAVVVNSVADLRLRIIAAPGALPAVAGALDRLRPSRIREILGAGSVAPLHRHRSDPERREAIVVAGEDDELDPEDPPAPILAIRSGRISYVRETPRRRDLRRDRLARIAMVVDVPFLNSEEAGRHSINIVAGPDGFRRRRRTRGGRGLRGAMIDASIPAGFVHRLAEDEARTITLPDFGHEVVGTTAKPGGTAVRQAYFDTGRSIAAEQIGGGRKQLPSGIQSEGR